MSKIEVKQPFSIYNPYRASYIKRGWYRYTQELLRSHHPSDPIMKTADFFTRIGRNLLFNNYEKYVDLTGKVTTFIENDVLVLYIATKILLAIDWILKVDFPGRTQVGAIISRIIRISGIAFLVTGSVRFFVEVVRTRRTALFLKKIRRMEQDPLKQLQWIKRYYFSLRQDEAEKIQSFIEKALPDLCQKEKVRVFDRIALKALKVKYGGLKRRLTPALGEELAAQLNKTTSDLKSWFPHVRTRGRLRADALMKSVERQAKVKILVHLLAIAAIGISMTSLCLTLGLGISGTALIGFTVASMALMVTQILVQRGWLNNEITKLYDRLEDFNLPTKVFSPALPWS